MKRLLLLFSFCALTVTVAVGQTLADAAREQQAKKKTPTTTGHVYTNESLEFHAAPPDATASAKSGDKTSSTAKADAKSDEAAPDADAPDPAVEKKKAADAIKDKYAKQQADLVQLQRELDVMVRENRIRAAVYYADAGARLRDEAKYSADDRKYQADIAAKQKAIADGQANLDKIREEARRAGVPLS
jgi:hypothetical protein